MTRQAALVLIAGACLAGCGDQSCSVSDDSEMAQVDGSDWALIRTNGAFLVPPRVLAITCYGEWAYGEHDGSGFFLLDRRDNSLTDKLTETELSDELSARGIEYQPAHLVSSFGRSWNGCG